MVFKKLKTYSELVMFSHTLFSLPFAAISMMWAAKGLPSMKVILWILVAFVGARTGANALNRLIDKDIDAKNPRTAKRHLPKGIVKNYEVVILSIISFSLMALAAFKLNPLCVKLLPLAIIIFIVYSYTKRFTYLCHIILGIACGGAPVGAWIAVTGEIGWPSLVLGAVVMLWVAGFDIIYGSQDYDFDKKEGLYSIPVRFGIKNALQISTIFHIIAILLLIYLYFIMNMGFLYLSGVVIDAILLYIEHRIVSPDNLSNVKIASYSINEVVSVVLFLFTAADILLLR
ncbi:4-hydroxybenzoate polyprenyltransferase [Caloramator quimbayensis]|uniref:4-hydroxybenzoate polyprenyltransferase n=1 Tax=Caloramator quimbayensis TaxID=1147123 RepID=A0A1T4XEQ4_9CLOT|nr:UbiA-like polyprenyltransferase [Caloramator quimbayensis]SKA87867.1 4-hydroxybenzoate polyprenyltransferase [Caloramator quimbayensis]